MDKEAQKLPPSLQLATSSADLNEEKTTKQTVKTEEQPQGTVVDENAANLYLSNRNFATSRKVQKLLDITVHDNFRELVLYMNSAVPEFLENLLPPSDPSPGERESPLPNTHSQETPHPQYGVPASSSIALRTALEGRVVDLHSYFLQEWSLLNDVFEEASDLVTKIQSDSETLQTTLDTHAAKAEEFVALMTTLQAELTLVQQREEEMKEFQEKYRFGPEEQRVLEEGPVDATYLDVLKRVQATHRKCHDLLLSREHYKSAAALMDITYSAIMKGTEKVTRYLMSASSALPSEAMRALSVTFGNTSVGGDSPELTSFYLRCVHFLREESPGQWAAVVEEVARLRRAAVLRQYFHLMTTGSATTPPGTYRAGDAAVNLSSHAHAESTGARALEAEMGNPVFFFSSLFAWLHQVIVDEDDFFTAFLGEPGVEASAQQKSETIPSDFNPSEVNTNTVANAASGKDTTEDVHIPAESDAVTPHVSKAALLNTIFEVLCKHIQNVLDGVLERFLRGASNHHDDNQINNSGGGGLMSGPLGPMGLTGNIARLFGVATGRPTAGSSMSNSSEVDANGRVVRYKNVMSRAQQEAIVASTIAGLTNGLRTAHKLLQLFSYYSYSTFSALLGREAALTQLVSDDAKHQILRIYQTIAKQLANHAVDSVAGVLTQSTTLRRLASSAATAAEAFQVTAATTTAEDAFPTSASESSFRAGNANANCAADQNTLSSYFVTEYLFETLSAEGADGGNESHIDADHAQPISLTSSLMLRSGSVSPSLNHGEAVNSNYSTSGQLSASVVAGRSCYRSNLSNHCLQAAEMWRMLRTMILPVPPEVEEYLRVLQFTLVETERQMEIMESVRAVLSKTLSKTANNDTPPALSSGVSGGMAYDGQFFMVLVQYAFSFPLTLARHETVNTSLDEPCKLTLQLNAMAALEETLAPHLDLLQKCNTTAGHATPLSDVVPQRIEQLTQELAASLAKCAVRHYFHRKPRGTSFAMEESSRSISVNNVHVFDTNELDGATIAAQLSEFYGSIAASGHVYVPLISAIRVPRLQEKVLQGVLLTLCAVYDERYAKLMEMHRNGAVDQAAVTELSEMEPRKLRILLDISA